MYESQIDLKFGVAKLILPSLIEIVINEGSVFDIKQVLETKEAFRSLCNGAPYGVLVDAKYHFTPTPEARELLADVNFSKNRIATALVINSLPQKIIGNFYLKFNRPPDPNKIFNDKVKAIEWLKATVEKSEKFKIYQRTLL